MKGAFCWSIEFHRKLLNDSIRNNAFQSALKSLIKPKKSVVVDIGSGTGYLSFLAIKNKAAKCYAYEMDEKISKLSDQLARKNSFYPKLKITCTHSSLVKNPPKADIVISESLGSFCLEEGIIENMEDAKRFLEKEGKLMPCQLDHFVVPVISEKCQNEIDTWKSIDKEINFDVARDVAIFNVYQKPIFKNDIYQGPQANQKIDSIDFYQKNSGKDRLSKKVTWRFPNIVKNPTISGFCLWWKAFLTPEIFFSTSPNDPPTHWEQIYIPLEEPIHILGEDFVDFQLYTNYLDPGIDIRWHVIQRRKNKNILVSGKPFPVMKK